MERLLQMETEQTIVRVPFKEKGLLNNINYIAHITSKRFVALHETEFTSYFIPNGQMDDNWEHFKKSLENNLDVNDVGEKQLLTLFTEAHSKCQIMNRYTIDQVLQIDKKSFSIPNQEITAITMNKKGTMNIKTGKKTKKYTTDKNRIQTTIQALSQIYGKKFLYTEN
jgi:hypothetical protein